MRIHGPHECIPQKGSPSHDSPDLILDSWYILILWGCNRHQKIKGCDWQLTYHLKFSQPDVLLRTLREAQKEPETWSFYLQKKKKPTKQTLLRFPAKQFRSPSPSPRITITSNPTAPSSACRRHSGCSRTRPCPSHFRWPLEADPPVKPRWTSCLEGDMVEIGWTGDGAKVSKACTPSVHIKIAGIYISNSHMIFSPGLARRLIGC